MPEHLRPTYRVVDDAGAEQARGKDLEELKEPLRPRFAQAIAEVAADSGFARTGSTTWEFGEVPATFTQRRAGHEVLGHPTLVDEGATVGLQVVGSVEEQEARHRLGVRRLLLLGLDKLDHRDLGLTNAEQLGLAGSPYPRSPTCSRTVGPPSVGDLVDARPPVRTEEEYDGLLRWRGPDARGGPAADDGRATCQRVLAAWRETERRLGGRADLHPPAGPDRPPGQLARLVHPGFVGEAGAQQLRQLPRFLAAMDARHEKLLAGGAAVNRDRELMDRVPGLQEAYLHQLAALPDGPSAGRAGCVGPGGCSRSFRVSLWAQQLGTASSVPAQAARLSRAGWAGRVARGATRRPRCVGSSKPPYGGGVTSRPHHRPSRKAQAFFDDIIGGDDPALLAEAGDRAALLLVRGARETDDAEVAERLLHLADTEGLEAIAEMWSGSPAESLAGCLWRL